MAWNPSKKVAECRNIAQKYKKDQVIILMLDWKHETLEYASYGKTEALCKEAKRLAEIAYRSVAVNV